MTTDQFQFRRRTIEELLLRGRHRETWFSGARPIAGETGVCVACRRALCIERRLPRALTIPASNARRMEVGRGRFRHPLTGDPALLAGKIGVRRMLAERVGAVLGGFGTGGDEGRLRSRFSTNDGLRPARECWGSVRRNSRPVRLQERGGDATPVDPTAGRQCEALRYSRRGDELVRASCPGDLWAERLAAISHTGVAVPADPARPVARGRRFAAIAITGGPISTRGKDTRHRVIPGEMFGARKVPFGAIIDTIVHLDRHSNDGDRWGGVR